jgi:hypothetical protein
MEEEKTEFFLQEASHVTAVTFTTLEERMLFHHSELTDGLLDLKKKIREQEYEKYINSLISLRKNGDKLLLITGYAVHKSIIEGKFLHLIKEVFDVSDVRIVSQTGQFNAF